MWTRFAALLDERHATQPLVVARNAAHLGQVRALIS